MKDISHSLKDLIGSWTKQNLPKKTYFELLLNIWQGVSPNKKAIVGELLSEKQELVIEVEDHLLMCDLQFQTLEILKNLNEQLAEQQEPKINKLRFRLKT